MKLKKVIISGFKSIKNQEALLIDEKITILIGANDHGKTNMINALEFLNDEKTFSEDDVNWDIKEPKDKVSIEWHFTPSVDVLNKISQSESDEVEDQENIFIDINTDNQIIFYRDFEENRVRVKSVPVKIPISKENEILQFKPRIELFSPPSTNLKDVVNVSQLETDEFEFMQGIFRLAGIWDLRNEVFTHDDKTSKVLEEASLKLTSLLNSKWNQGKDLKWKFEHTGNNGDHIVLKILDPSIGTRYTRPSLRSSGFKTYFLLSMIIFARTEKSASSSFIYLFDEPGTYLHPYAQLDLQRSFETLSNKVQIIYTTHSLFLINKNYPDRNRVVSKTREGTKIDQKPFVRNWKSVRESLGILLSNNFLIAEKTLLVEGPSDVIYILHAIKKLKNYKEIDVDLNDLSIVDAGNSENYLAMSKLMISEGRDVVALLDGDKAGDDMEKNLKKICEKEIKDKKLQILKLPKNKSIEDVFVDCEKLRESIKKVSDELISLGIRTLKEGVNLEDEIKKITFNESITLGKTIDDCTRNIFESNEKLSKLSVALVYEDLINDSIELPSDAKKQIQSIAEKLDLKKEITEEISIFEEL